MTLGAGQIAAPLGEGAETELRPDAKRMENASKAARPAGFALTPWGRVVH